jgi:hypothetical protein
MAYGIKYRLEYTGLGGYETRIDIKREGYVGSIIEVKGSSFPFELTYEESDDNQFTVFKNSHCSLNLIETPALIADFKEIEDEDDFILEYFRNGVKVWSGYIMAEEYLEGDDVSNPWLRLKFYDAISRTRIYSFDDLILDVKDRYSLAELFNAVNSKLYSKLGGSNGVLFNNFLANTINTSSNLLDIIYVQRRSFFDKDNIALNLYDILSNVASSFNFTYLLYIDRLMITNFEFSANSKFVDFGNSKTVVSLGAEKTFDSNHLFIDISKEISFLDSLKKMKIFHKIDEDINSVEIERFTTVTGTTPPTLTGGEIKFTTYANESFTTGPIDLESPPVVNTGYRNASITNTRSISVFNPTGSTDTRSRYRLSFSYVMEFDYNVTDAMIDAMTEELAKEARDKRKNLNENTFIRLGLNMRIPALDFSLTGSSFSNDFGNPIDLFYVGGARDLSSVSRETLFQQDFFLPTDQNEITLKFYQPTVFVNIIPSSNDHAYTQIRLKINDVALTRIELIDLEEFITVGTTDRNVFNYNLNRDREYFYLDRQEMSYRFTLSDSDGFRLPNESFRRRSSDYSTVVSTPFSVASFLLTQSLEQFGFQQELITGGLFVKDSGFNILSFFNVGGKLFPIKEFTLSDYDSTYNIKLIEIK